MQTTTYLFLVMFIGAYAFAQIFYLAYALCICTLPHFPNQRNKTHNKIWVQENSLTAYMPNKGFHSSKPILFINIVSIIENIHCNFITQVVFHNPYTRIYMLLKKVHSFSKIKIKSYGDKHPLWSLLHNWPCQALRVDTIFGTCNFLVILGCLQIPSNS